MVTAIVVVYAHHMMNKKQQPTWDASLISFTPPMLVFIIDYQLKSYRVNRILGKDKGDI